MNWLKRLYRGNAARLRKFYNWLVRTPAPYEQYRVKAIIKMGKKKFKVRAKDYAEFVKIITNAKEGRKDVPK